MLVLVICGILDSCLASWWCNCALFRWRWSLGLVRKRRTGFRVEGPETSEEFYLRRSYFDEEAAALVGHLEDFGPGETVDPQFVFVNHQATGANAQHDVNTVQILTEKPQPNYQCNLRSETFNFVSPCREISSLKSWCSALIHL